MKNAKTGVVVQRSSDCSSLEDEQALRRMISGALRDTMNAHGPVGPPDIGSAAKRIAGTITGNFCFRRKTPAQKSPGRPKSVLN